MLRFVQIRNNRYENRLIFLLLANKNIVFHNWKFVVKSKKKTQVPNYPGAEVSWCRIVPVPKCLAFY
jgi:hypothetical protein